MRAIKQGLSKLRAFARREEGVTVIETAMILPIFFAIVFSIFEVGHVFYKSSIVEQEMAEAARVIKVGRAFTADFKDPAVDPDACPYGQRATDGTPCKCHTGQECFFDALCERIDNFLTKPCMQQLSFEVNRYATFDDIPANAFAGTCPNDPGYKFKQQTYDPGKSNDVVLLRVCFLMDTYSPLFGAMDMSTEIGGARRIVSVQLHRNEPYDPDEEEDD